MKPTATPDLNMPPAAPTEPTTPTTPPAAPTDTTSVDDIKMPGDGQAPTPADTNQPPAA